MIPKRSKSITVAMLAAIPIPIGIKGLVMSKIDDLAELIQRVAAIEILVGRGAIKTDGPSEGHREWLSRALEEAIDERIEAKAKATA